VTRSTVRGLSVIAALGCLPLAACSTGFGAPTRHATANLQAASFNLGTTLEVRGAIVTVPVDGGGAKGGVAYVELNAINLGPQADQLTAATVDPSVAANSIAVGSVTVPAQTATGPGTARLVYALEPLAKQLNAGDEVDVTLQFANGGAATDLAVPVVGGVSSFTPSSPPPVPVSSPPASSPVASAVSSPVASAPASAPPVASAPASAPPASVPVSPLASPASS
jgi:hypothetical protein